MLAVRAHCKQLEATVFLVLVLCIPVVSAADRNFRCGASLIEIGDEKAAVLSECGEPDGIDQWEEDPE